MAALQITDHKVYSDSDKRRVLAWLRRAAGPDAARPIRECCAELGLSSRVVRAVFSDCDGFELVVGYAARGVFHARTAAEAEAGTASLRSRATQLRRRVEAREHFYSGGGSQRGFFQL